jgi:hypothetical protein
MALHGVPCAFERGALHLHETRRAAIGLGGRMAEM